MAEGETQPKRYTSTKCRVIDGRDLEFRCSQTNPSVNLARVTLTDDTIIQPNYFNFPDHVKLDQPFRYFLMDHMEHVKVRLQYRHCANDDEKFEKARPFLKSMTDFSKHFKKNLYLRLLPPLTVGNEKQPRILVSEMIELIPIAMKQEKPSRVPHEANMQELREMYPETDSTFTTITVGELELILDALDINKSLITCVPDPAYARMLALHVERGDTLIIPGPEMKWVISTYQSVNFLFETLVVGIDWTKECTEHKECNAKTKEVIVRWMEHMAGLSEVVYTDPGILYRFIRKPAVKCVLNRKKGKGVLDVFPPSPDKETFITRYHRTAKEFNLPKYPIFALGSRRDWMPDWEIKLLGELGWMQQFFGEDEHPPVKYILAECLFFHAPWKQLPAARKFVNTIIPPQYKQTPQEEPAASKQEPSTSDDQGPSTSQPEGSEEGSSAEGSSTPSGEDGSETELAKKTEGMKIQPKRSGRHKKKKGKKGKKGKK